MKKITKTVISYQCEVCKTIYPSKKEALGCEKSPVEEKLFKKGWQVAGIEQQVCSHCGPKEKYFLPKGKIVKIEGPEPVEYNFSRRRLGAQLLGMHAWVYLVRYSCLCGEEREHFYYSPEIKALKKVRCR